MKLKIKSLNFEFFVLFFLSLIITFRYFYTKPNYIDGDVLKITTRVYSEPIIYENSQFITIQGLKTYLPKYPEVNYGDKIIVKGVVSEKIGKGFYLINPKILQVDESKAFLYNLRQKLIYFYKRSLPEPYSSLVAGITIGSKNMPQAFWEVLKKTGTAHVVVASGTNVTMLSAFLISILTYFFNRRHAVFITLAGIVGYIILSGFDAPIIRAGIMGSIVFLAQLTGRVSNSWRILVFTGLIMLLIKPAWLTDLGFILSFVATASLMLFQSKVNEKLKFVPSILREGLSTSLAAQIGVAPILFVTFGQFNLISPVINAFILWTVNYIMIFGALGGILGLFIPFLGRVLLLLSFPFLYWFVKVVTFFWIMQMNIYKYLRNTLLLIAILIWLSIFLIDDNLHIVACDVGQGDAILIQKNSTQILIDGGPSKKVLDCLGSYMPFWDRTIELVISTHPQEDHYGGLIDVVKTYNVLTYAHNGTTSSSQSYGVLQKEIGSRGIATMPVNSGMVIRLDLIYLDILNPERIDLDKELLDYSTNPNDDGVVVLLRYDQFKALFTADVENKVSDRLSNLDQIENLNYIKVNHHGSKNGLSQKLLDITSPDIAVISVGKDNRYKHPDTEVLDMLGKLNINIFRTDIDGSVEVVTNGVNYWTSVKSKRKTLIAKKTKSVRSETT